MRCDGIDIPVGDGEVLGTIIGDAVDVGADDPQRCGRVGVGSRDGIRVRRSRLHALLFLLILWLHHLIRIYVAAALHSIHRCM